MVEVWGYNVQDVAPVLGTSIVIGLLGLVGNALSLVVWTRPKIKSSAAILVIALAIADITVIVCNISLFCFYVLSLYFYNIPIARYHYDFIYPYLNVWVYPVLKGAETVSIYLTLTITTERYVAICYPFQYRYLWTNSRSRQAVALVVIFSTLYNMAGFWEREVIATPDIDGKIVYKNIKTELRLNPLYISFYVGRMTLIIRFLFPLAGIVGFNVAIYLALRKAWIARKTMVNVQKTDNWITVMLMYVVGEFLVCSISTGFAATCIGFGFGEEQIGFSYMLLKPVHIFLSNLNSSINFATYIIFSKPFRRIFLQTFGCEKESFQPLGLHSSPWRKTTIFWRHRPSAVVVQK